MSAGSIRADRIAELSGRNMRYFGELIGLLVAIRILGNDHGATGSRTVH